MRKVLALSFVLLATAIIPAKAAQSKKETIAGISVKVLSEYRSSFGTRFVTLVIPDEAYSREHLEHIWRHYCEKYDKKDRLDVRVYAHRSYEYDQAFKGLPSDAHTGEVISSGKRFKLRGPDAMFERKGDGILAYGGDNELMIFRPNLDKPDEKESIWLAGKNSVR